MSRFGSKKVVRPLKSATFMVLTKKLLISIGFVTFSEMCDFERNFLNFLIFGKHFPRFVRFSRTPVNTQFCAK